MRTEGDAPQTACALRRSLQFPRFAAIFCQQRVSVAENYPTAVFVSKVNGNTGLIGFRLNFPIITTINGMKDKSTVSTLRCNRPSFLTIDKVKIGDVCCCRPGFLNFPSLTAIGCVQGLSNPCPEPSLVSTYEMHCANARQVLLGCLKNRLPCFATVFGLE